MNQFGSGDGYDPGYGTFGSDYGGNNGLGDVGPVVLDLSGKGIAITPLGSSAMTFDMADDGYQHHTAWAGAGNGVLVLDTKGNGQITERNQVVFTDWDPAAATDMEALRDVFDTNGNGRLDAGDAQFAKFKILVTNPDGTTTLETLAQAGVASIDLSADKTQLTFEDGSSIDGQASFTRTDGTTGTAATATFAYDPEGHPVRTTTTHYADGSTNIDTILLDGDGNSVGEIFRGSNGSNSSTVVSTDTTGDGVIDFWQSTHASVAPDGSRVASTTFHDMASLTTGFTNTTISADGRTVTILRSADPSSAPDQREVRATNPDGSRSVVVTNLDPDGSSAGSMTYVVSADGRTGTTTADLDGNGSTDLTSLDQTAVNADGSRTRTVTETNPNGALRDRTVTTASADARTKTVQTDADGDGVFDGTTRFVSVRNADGGTTTTRTDFARNGATVDLVRTTVSGDGLTTITQSDLDGNGTIDLTRTDSTVRNADGSRTETVSDTNVRGALLDRIVVAKGADGISRYTDIDSDGDGIFETTDLVAVTPTWGITETTSAYKPDGQTLVSRTIKSTSPDHHTETVQVDANGEGTFDRTTTAVTSPQGDSHSTVTVTDRSADNTLIDRAVTTTSVRDFFTAQVTTQQDIDGNGAFDLTTTNSIDGNWGPELSRSATVSSGNGTLLSRIASKPSADLKTSTFTGDANGDGATDQTETTVVQSDGSTVDTVTATAPNGTKVSSATTTTSANGLSVTTQRDDDGNGTIDLTTSDVTVLNLDGSTTERASVKDASGKLLSRTLFASSAHGFATAVQADLDGDGSVDQTATTGTALNADGSSTVTLTRSAGTTVVGWTITTTSANGLSKTVQTDLNGDGSFDRVETDTTTLNADGTRTRTVRDSTPGGVQQGQVVTRTSADRKTVTTSYYAGTSASAAMTRTVVTQADGSQVATIQQGDITLTQSTDAQGLSTSASLSRPPVGVFDAVTARTQTFQRTLNADGSSTVAVHVHNESRAAPFSYDGEWEDMTTTTTTSRDGLSVTTARTGLQCTSVVKMYPMSSVQYFGDLEGTTDLRLTSTDVTTLLSDGGQVRTRTVHDGSNRTSVATHTVSADGLHVSDTLDTDGNGSPDLSDVLNTGADGSMTETMTILGSNSRTTVTESANGQILTLARDANGDGVTDLGETAQVSSDGASSDVITTSGTAAVLASRAASSLTADGLNLALGFSDARYGSLLSVNVVRGPDGTLTSYAQEFSPDIGGLDRIKTTRSANGLAITAAIDIYAIGVTDETVSDVTQINADGSTVRTVRTAYADGSLASQSVLSTSADGLTATTSRDLDGDGQFDLTVTTTKQFDGATHTIQSSGTRTDVSADGLQTTISSDDGGETRITQLADGFGSYNVITAPDLYFDQGSGHAGIVGGLASSETHVFDANGMDEITVGGGSLPTTIYRKSIARENQDRAADARAYDTLLDRDPSFLERTQDYLYASTSNLIDKLLNSTEFNNKYGQLNNLQFVERMYRNALDRDPTVDQAEAWVKQLQTGTSRAAVALTISESAEHLALGNIHTITNNTISDQWRYSLDHTLDRAAAGVEVMNLYTTILGRRPTSTEMSINETSITKGTATDASLAASLLASSEFAARYGTRTDIQFVNQIISTGLGRSATTDESSFWTSELSSRAISRADFAVAVANSYQDSASINRLVQAMAVINASSLASSTPTLSTIGHQEIALAPPH